ncbi:patatin-like phospholipase family protein [Pseudarthrobacter sp. YS3]|uniref:patatin-like phospholipase family protein n=1 Tax=Pseudarthrobacter sp. YS3 TaxID=3453718 RepID=UPI003EF0588B
MTVGICLSGGGAKGDFQVGALRYLYDRSIRPTILCSTSVGSVNAIKLAEGEDPGNPNRGLAGLERQWSALQRNSDMFSEEDWLNDPDMDVRVRDVLTGRSKGLGISAPNPDAGRWGDLGPLIQVISDIGFLIDDGADLLKSLNVVAKRARALYNLGPIERRLRNEVDMAAVNGWASAGGKLRLAAVALESGNLRYVTEAGTVIERDGSPILWAGPLTPACATILGEAQGYEADIADLQEDLRNAAPGEKAQIVREIRRLRAPLERARAGFEACRKAQPPVPLTVDFSTGVLASASIPGIFPPVAIGDEHYVDGGVRELLPIQAAVTLGADTIYAVSAFTFNVSRRDSFARAHLAEILARSVEDLMLNEIGLDDTRVQPPAASPVPKIFLIAPDVEIHDVTTIDPGLIQINRDYGYMRAADALDQVGTETRRWALATDIAVQRRDTWSLENRRFGHEDPTRPAERAQAADPALQGDIDAGKARLQTLLDERSGLGAPMPYDIERWVGTLELHPWTGMLNDAVFVRQEVPNSLPRGASLPVTITMRNSGTTTWTPANSHRLGSQSPQDNLVWGSGRQELPNAVGPGAQVTFAFTITAPPPPGATFQWRMLQEGNEWFGSMTPAVFVGVEEATECVSVRAAIAELQADISALQQDLANAAPGEKAQIVRQINAAQNRVREQRARYDQLGCN